MPDLANLTFTEKSLERLEPGDLIVYKEHYLMRCVANLPSSNPGTKRMLQLAYWTHTSPETFTFLEVKHDMTSKVPTFRLPEN